MNIRRQTFNGLSTIHTVVMVARNKYFMPVRQIAKPIHKVVSLSFRASESEVA